MHLRGNWVSEDDTQREGELWAWGEWEAESSATSLERPNDDPRLSPYLWKPYYRRPRSYAGLHSTDPFIFGKRFLYSHCGQRAGGNSGLKHLGRGSIIIFGSQFRGEWVLDTVLVVAGSKRYEASRADIELERLAPRAFLDVTARRIADSGEEGELAFYWGATPDDPVDGMFSFFPAQEAGGDVGFARPGIELPSGYFTNTQRRRHKHTCSLGSEELVRLWECIVSQVRDSGLHLGTHAAPPRRRRR